MRPGTEPIAPELHWVSSDCRVTWVQEYMGTRVLLSRLRQNKWACWGAAANGAWLSGPHEKERRDGRREQRILGDKPRQTNELLTEQTPFTDGQINSWRVSQTDTSSSPIPPPAAVDRTPPSLSFLQLK